MPCSITSHMTFSTELAAIDAARNCQRRYRVKAFQDLLGDWLVTITFGRIGASGRTVVHVADDESQARRIVMSCLRSRGTAPRRIGVAYVERERSASASWSEVGADTSNQPAKPRPASA